MQTSLQGISKKAERVKNHRFQDLFRLLNEEMLTEAWRYINKKSATGVDKETAQEFEANLKKNIETIVGKLKRKNYKARLIRQVFIPKDNGKTRALGIPAISDKIVQMAVSWILQAIYEEDFLKFNYGYRPKRGAKELIKELTKELQFGSYNYIVEADIQGFFDTIDHNWLLKMLEQRINDKSFIWLIKKWLKAGILETNGKVVHPDTGTPQGGIVSPVLANIYLHYVLDLWFDKKIKKLCQGKACMYRYADDWVCAFQYKEDAKNFYSILSGRLKKFGLKLATEKTKIIRFSKNMEMKNGTFEFLGFKFKQGLSRKGKPLVKRRTSPKKFRAAVKRMTQWCKISRHIDIGQKFKQVNVKLVGHYNYYGVIGNYKSLNQFCYLTRRSLFKWLNRRSQRKSFNWEKFERLMKRYGIEKPRITEKIDRQVKFRFRYA